MTTKPHHQNKDSQCTNIRILNKQQIKDVLYAELYDPVIRHFKTRIENLARLNSFLGCHSHGSFTYKGKLYNHLPDEPPAVKAKELIPSLHPLMNLYLKDLDAINLYELPHVLDYIHRLLNKSNNLQHQPERSDQNKQRSSSNTFISYSSPLEQIYSFANQDLKALGLINQRRAKNLLL
jgi:hypothetical protein